MKYKVSVILPAYNEEKRMAKTLTIVNAYCNKHFSDYEIIVVDDCSTDNSLPLVKEILKNLNGVKHTIITNQTNQGVYRQWLKGINTAKNEIVWIAEADDIADACFL